MPFSYAQYAGNGSTTTFSVPFPYLLKAHVKLYTGFNILTGAYTSLLVDGADYTWTSTTQVQTTVAPANGVTLTVIRDTPDSTQLVPWQDGSNLVADDMNIADLQNLYVVQEQQDRNDAGITQSTAAAAAATAATTAANTATSTANTALSTANAATSTANTALSTANTASSNASAAVSTANTASSNASAAVTTANAANATAGTASTNASNAVTTANAAAANAATALSTANTAATNASAAVSTANTASSNAAAAVSTANTANTNASNAVTTANTASTNASAAVSTANAASTTATNAATTANTANNKADQAIAAVSNSVNYQLKANVAAIPASPANDTYIEVQDSTGLESFTPLAGKPAGFVGDAGLSVRLRYTTAGTTWNWLNYYANDSDARFLKKTGGTMTGPIVLSGAPTTGLNPATKTYVDGYVSSLQGDIGTVSTAAAGAQSTANTAVANAATAQTTANTAVSNAATAQSAANAAQSTANTAVSNAAAAQSTANTAVTNAAAAQATADAALPKAGGTATGNISAPAFIPTGGTAPTNGVYLPAANSVAISTNGNGRLFINSTGLMGVGTSAPRFIQDTVGTTNGPAQIVAGFGSTSATNGDGTAIGFSTEAAQGVTGRHKVGIGSIRTGSFDRGALCFYLNNTASAGNFTSSDERLRITSDGLVGIGNTAPEDHLSITANNYRGLTLQTATSTDRPTVYFRNTGAAAASFVQGLGQNLIFGRAPASDYGSHTETARIDSSGRLLVGTSSARTQFFNNFIGTSFQIEGTGSGRMASIVSNNTDGGVLILGRQGGSTPGGNTLVANGDEVGLLSFQAADGSDFVEAARINCFVDGTPGANDMPGRLVFSTTADGASSPTERMRIDSSGRLQFNGIGAGFGAITLHTTATNVGSTSTALWINVTSTSYKLAQFEFTGGPVGTITTNGSSTAYNTTSDYRLKENITAVADGITRLQQLKPSRFNFIANPGHTVDGFIAHEVQSVVPEAITGAKDEVDADGNPVYQGIDQSKLVPLLTAALQEAIGEIESLKARVAALESA